MDSSPLALLAQTCNSIGLPDLPPASKCNNGGAASGKLPKNDLKSDSISKKLNKDDLKTHSSSKTTTMADSTSEAALSGRRSNSSTNSDQPRKGENRSKTSAHQTNVSATETKTSTTSDTKPTSSSLQLAAGGAGKCGGFNANPMTFPANYPSALFPPFYPSTSAAYAFGPSALPLTAGACYPPFPGSGAWLTSGSSPALAGFAPKCSDPFCKTCPAIAAAARSSGPCATIGCPCNQQHNDLSSFWLSSLFGLHGAVNPPAANPLFAAAASAYAASTAPSTNASSSGGGQQHTCSWMTGNEFCGKRFNSSEELLQHLRTHTSQESAKSPLVTSTTANPAAGRSSP
jgi:hypothetical protein